MARKPIIALVGRPNVGKSTLFNRLAGERLAIVEDIPGTTRDRQYTDIEWGGRALTLIDTGGLVVGDTDHLISQVRAQAHVAIEEADVILLITDITQGVTVADQEIADILRRTDKPVIVVTNKADNLKREMDIYEFHALGLGEPIAASAIRGLSTGDLLDRVLDVLPPPPPEEPESEALRIAIVGRPNVGKSSLVNKLLGQDRVIVNGTPGTTRDAIDTAIRYHGQDIVLIDTAGIRRRGRIAPGIEKYSVLRALKALSRADLALLLIDASQGVTEQDAHVAGYILEQTLPIIVLVNKWDAVAKDTHTMAQYETYVRDQLKFMSYVPILFISALTGQRVNTVLPTVIRIHQARQTRLSTSEINDIIREATARHSPPSKWGKKLRIYYGTQVSTTPPTFILFVNDPRLVHFSYHRYLENQIRRRYKFEGSPLRLVFRGHQRRER